MVHRLRPNVKPEKKALILKALTLQKNSSVLAVLGAELLEFGGHFWH
jgi:hypothetical protein